MSVLCIVQARMGSERFPGKVIEKIINKPMIIHVLDRLKKSKYIDDIVLATSNKQRDKKLVKIVRLAGYKVFAGEEDNVLKRYNDASDMYGGDIIVRITGDCPLIDYRIVDNVISYFKMYDYDYVRIDVPDSFIRGFDVEVFSKKSLSKVYKKICDKNTYEHDEYDYINMYKEHVTLYMYRHPEEFRVGYIKGESYYNIKYRVCVDTKEDFQLVKNIYEYFNDEYVSAKDVVKYLNENKEIVRINSNIDQKHLN